MSKLTAAMRKAIPSKNFAIKSRATTPAGKAKSGSYPIEDLAHARNALARSSGKPEAGQVRAAVYAKYPQLRKKSSAGQAKKGATMMKKTAGVTARSVK